MVAVLLLGEGAFVSSGTDQLVSISEYFNEYENSGEDNQKSEEQVDKQDGNKSEQGNQSTGEKPMNDKAKAEEEFLKNNSRNKRKRQKNCTKNSHRMQNIRTWKTRLTLIWIKISICSNFIKWCTAF